MPGYFSVKGFERFQHYKDRTPPWIKLYNELLDDYEFGRLPDASKMHLVAIWLLASRYSNRVPHDSEWIARRINATDAVDLEILSNAGFILPEQECSTSLADCKQSAMPEKEVETEESSEPNGSGADAPIEPEDLKSRIFGPALQWLAEHSAKSERSLRPMVGRWCRDHGDGNTLEALQQAARAGPVDPIAWIEARLAGTAKQTFGQPFKTSELLERMAENEADGFGEESDPDGNDHAVPCALPGPERGAGGDLPERDPRNAGAVQSNGGRADEHVGEIQAPVDEDDMADAGRTVPRPFH